MFECLLVWDIEQFILMYFNSNLVSLFTRQQICIVKAIDFFNSQLIATISLHGYISYILYYIRQALQIYLINQNFCTDMLAY